MTPSPATALPAPAIPVRLISQLSAVAASLALTAGMVGGYIYYVHTRLIPEIRQAAQVTPRPVRQLLNLAVARELQRGLLADDVSLVPALALFQSLPGLLPVNANGAFEFAPTTGIPRTNPEPAAAPPSAPVLSATAWMVNNVPTPTQPEIVVPEAADQPLYVPSQQAQRAVPAAALVTTAPPPPQAESVPANVPADSYWSPGYWVAGTRGNYTWTPGRVERKPPQAANGAAVFVPAQYVWQGNGYVFIAAHWENVAPTPSTRGRSGTPVTPPTSFSSTPAYTGRNSVPVGEPVKMPTSFSSTPAYTNTRQGSATSGGVGLPVSRPGTATATTTRQTTTTTTTGARGGG